MVHDFDDPLYVCDSSCHGRHGKDAPGVFGEDVPYRIQAGSVIGCAIEDDDLTPWAKGINLKVWY